MLARLSARSKLVSQSVGEFGEEITVRGEGAAVAKKNVNVGDVHLQSSEVFPRESR